MLFSICSHTENVYDPTFFVEPLWGHVRTLRELFLVSRTDDDPLCVDSKTPPCVHSQRPRVCRHHAQMCSGTTRRCVPASSGVHRVCGALSGENSTRIILCCQLQVCQCCRLLRASLDEHVEAHTKRRLYPRCQMWISKTFRRQIKNWETIAEVSSVVREITSDTSSSTRGLVCYQACLLPLLGTERDKIVHVARSCVLF